MIIRKASDEDCYAIYKLHIASIKHFCADFYPIDSINAWIESKSPIAYKDLLAENILIVSEENDQIIGFGLLNTNKNSIDSLYIAPNFSGRGLGGALLKKLEEIAHSYGIEKLTLFSTLNAIQFYYHMGYREETKSSYQLLSGVTLDCVKM